MSIIKIPPYILDSTLDFTFNNVTSTGTVLALSSNIGNITSTGNVNFTSTANVALGAIGNIHITGGTTGQVLTTNGSGGLSWSTVSGGGGGGSASVTVSNTAPSTPAEGDLWLDSETGDLNVYFGGAWGSVSDTSPQFTSIVNTFTGDSVTTAFTLTSTPAAKEYTLVAIGGVLQPRSTYSLSGNVITYSRDIPSNTPIEVTVLGGTGLPVTVASTVTSNAQPNITSVGTLVDLSVSGNLLVNGTKPATTGKAIAMSIVFGG